MSEHELDPSGSNLVLTGQQIAGLVVGEGCFYTESAPDPKYRLGWRIRPAFCIEMRADEKAVLEAVRVAIGCGRVYDLDFGRYRGYERKGWNPHVKYRVTALSELRDHVIPFFQMNPLFGRKAVAFALFSKLVELLAAGSHRSPDGLELGKKLASDLTGQNRAVFSARSPAIR